MSVTIYNLDKVDREVFKIKVGGVEHEIKEPTVKDFSLIQQIVKDNAENITDIFKIMCPTIEFEDLTFHQVDLLSKVCFKLIRGEGKKKSWIVEELME